ncbi:MAG: hypothetical protein GY722_19765, partial [bacterium]|nr:hypothetical protein [bacterium]
EGGAELQGEIGSEHAQALGQVMALLGGALQWEAGGGTSRAVLAFP